MEDRIGEPFGNGTLVITGVLQRSYHAPKGNPHRVKNANGAFECTCTVCNKTCRKWAPDLYAHAKRSHKCPHCHPFRVPWLRQQWNKMNKLAAKHGVSVCEQWQTFEGFQAIGERPPGKRLLWLDKTKGFTPDNFGWFDRKQVRTLSRRMYTVHGITKTMTEWSYITGVTKERMRQLFNTVTPEQAVLSFPAAVKWFNENGVPMARVVERFPIPDLDKYLDGRVWELTEGTDFDCTPETFRHVIYQRVRKDGIKVKTRIIGDKLFVQVKP